MENWIYRSDVTIHIEQTQDINNIPLAWNFWALASNFISKIYQDMYVLILTELYGCKINLPQLAFCYVWILKEYIAQDWFKCLLK